MRPEQLFVIYEAHNEIRRIYIGDGTTLYPHTVVYEGATLGADVVMEESEDAADKEAFKLLKNSPYNDKLGKAGLFLQALEEVAPETPNLFGAHMGNRLIDKHQELRMADLLQGAPKLQPDSIDQIAALPLGARIKVDAWSDSIRLMKSKPVDLVSAKDKMPFEVTPLIPYLTRYHEDDPQQQAQR